MRLVGWWSVLALAACTWGDGAARPTERSAERPASRRGAPARPEIAAGGSPRKLPDSVANGPTVDALPADQPALVVFVVLDTVRSSALQLCGNDRPTSKVIETLVQKGAAFTCDAYSPATWTLPSHTTFFTGLPATEHVMHRKGLRLDDSATTLAEVFAERGYQTIMLSANPVLKEGTGLQQGFHTAYAPRGLNSEVRQDGLAVKLKQELAQIDPAHPVFLFLNLFEAHDPYPAVPAESGSKARPPFNYKVNDPTDANPWYRFVKGTLTPDEEREWLAAAKDGYEYGVGQSDRLLGKLLKLLELHQLTEHGVRLVVTSDHGENLGEHRMMRHDGPPWDTVTRVPFLYWDSTRAEQIKLPTPFPTEVVFHLLKEGALPDTLPPARALSMAYGAEDPRYRDGVALWITPTEKLAWLDGKAVRYDLAADPGEDRPMPADDHPRLAELTTLVAAHAAAKAKADGMTPDAEMVKSLSELGYIAP